MEILTIVLAGLLSAASGGGLVLEKILQQRLASQVIGVERQAVRIDNRPNYQIAQGKLDRVRIASRGISIAPGLRIAEIDLEADEIALKPDKLSLDSLDKLRRSLVEPATGAARIVFTEADLNRALKSPEILSRLQATLNRLIISKAGSTNISYNIRSLDLELLPANRVRVNLTLARPSFNSVGRYGTPAGQNSSRELIGRGMQAPALRLTSLNMSVALKLATKKGQKIQILDLEGTVNDRPMSDRLLKGFAQGISDRLDLNSLADDGILARILQLEIDEDKLQLVSFVKLDKLQ